jgi:hypothetical protein
VHGRFASSEDDQVGLEEFARRRRQPQAHARLTLERQHVFEVREARCVDDRDLDLVERCACAPTMARLGETVFIGQTGMLRERHDSEHGQPASLR